jgi:hypothetical protein
MRVPFIQPPRKLPLKALAIVVGVSAIGTAGFAALSWTTANASRVSASEPVVRLARVMEITYQQRSRSLVWPGP